MVDVNYESQEDAVLGCSAFDSYEPILRDSKDHACRSEHATGCYGDLDREDCNNLSGSSELFYSDSFYDYYDERIGKCKIEMRDLYYHGDGARVEKVVHFASLCANLGGELGMEDWIFHSAKHFEPGFFETQEKCEVGMCDIGEYMYSRTPFTQEECEAQVRSCEERSDELGMR